MGRHKNSSIIQVLDDQLKPEDELVFLDSSLSSLALDIIGYFFATGNAAKSRSEVQALFPCATSLYFPRTLNMELRRKEIRYQFCAINRSNSKTGNCLTDTKYRLAKITYLPPTNA